MKEHAGCRALVGTMLMAVLLPWLATHCFRRWAQAGGGTAGPPAFMGGQAGRGAPACLEVWARLRSYRGCPLLAAAGGYRLGLYCPGGEGGRGLLAFAGPFAGRAYLSERPMPLGRWVHVAGMDPGIGGRRRPTPRPAPAPVPEVAPAPASFLWPLIAVDGADVTAGRALGALPPLPLGRDPWPSARLPSPPPAGDLGAWRFSRRWRTLAEVAAGRGAPGRLPPLPAAPAAPEAGPGPVDSETLHRPDGAAGRAWMTPGLSLTAALLLVAVALSVRRRPPGPRRSLGPARPSGSPRIQP